MSSSRKASGDSTPEVPTERSTSRDLRANFTRWNVKTIRSPFVIIVSLVQPILTLLMFGLVFGGAASIVLSNTGFEGVNYVTFIVPAVVLQVSLASALTSGIGLVTDIESGMFEKILVTPMGTTAVFAGKAASEFLRIVVQVLLVLALAVLVGGTIETGVLGVAGILAICLLVATWFMLVSNLLGVVTTDEESISTGTNLLQFPLLFLSSAFLPVSVLPGWIRAVATVNPVTHAADAIRALVLGRRVPTVIEVSWLGGLWDPVLVAIAVMTGLNVVFGALLIGYLDRVDAAALS